MRNLALSRRYSANQECGCSDSEQQTGALLRIEQPQTTIMPPKGSRKQAATPVNNTLVLDNGAYTLKAGIVRQGAVPTLDDCAVIPNCIARSNRDKRTYVGSALGSCKDFGELAFRRPVEKGFIVNWEAEKAIWEHEFLDSTALVGLQASANGPAPGQRAT